MHYLFQKSLKIGKRIRTDLPLGRGLPDIEHAIMNAGFHIFDNPEKARLLIVGVSDINRRILSFFDAKDFENITICNRSSASARAIAAKHKLLILDWEQLSQWPAYDWIIFGTKSSEHLISKKDLAEKSIGHKLLIDLCVPRNVDPNLGRDPRITLMNIDQINRSLNIRRQRMMTLLSHAEDIVHSDTKRQIELFSKKELKRHQIVAV
jgi:glutamyl-tRNA reductase